MSLLHKVSHSTGAKRAQYRKAASAARVRMIAPNRRHAEDDLPKAQYDLDKIRREMPAKYKGSLEEFAKTAEGKKALRKYTQFWGVPYPVEMKELSIPGPAKRTYRLVGLGRAPKAYVADGPKNDPGKIKTIKGPFNVTCDAGGRKLILLSGRTSNAKKLRLKFIGYVPQTEYIPSEALEKAGTFKKNKHWVHEHHDEGGSWPKAYMDQAGNIHYAPSTLRVGKWMRR